MSTEYEDTSPSNCIGGCGNASASTSKRRRSKRSHTPISLESPVENYIPGQCAGGAPKWSSPRSLPASPESYQPGNISPCNTPSSPAAPCTPGTPATSRLWGEGNVSRPRSASPDSTATTDNSPFFYRRIPFSLVPPYNTTDGDEYEMSGYSGQQNYSDYQDYSDVPYTSGTPRSISAALSEEDVYTDAESEYTDYSESQFPDPSMPLMSESYAPGRQSNVESPCSSIKAASFAGKGLFDRSGMGKARFEPWIEKNTSWRKSADESSSVYGPHFEEDESGYDYSDPERRKLGFDPYVHLHQLKKFASPYKDFGPPLATSTPYGASTPDKKTRDGWKYHSLVGEEEESFWRAPTPESSPRGRKTVHHGLTPGTAADDSATTAGIRDLLDEMEVMELSRIKKDLTNFQTARRRLIFDATHIKPL